MKSKNLVFDDGPVYIGSRDDNDIILLDETVSRQHCVITREGDFYIIKDLESTNGTFVNSTRIKEVFLEPGLEFYVGKTKVVFQPVKEDSPVVPLPGQAMDDSSVAMSKCVRSFQSLIRSHQQIRP